MNRRELITSLQQAALAVGVLPSRWMSRRSQAQQFELWTWVHGGRETDATVWQNRVAQLRDTRFRGLLVSGGDVARLAPPVRAAGLELHRWIWVLNRSGDSWAKEQHPEWFAVNRNGESSLEKPPYVGYYQWVCPTRRPVRDYLLRLVAEIADDPDVDGVHLDYIRHPDVILPVGLWSKYGLVQDQEYPEFDFCYCDVCRDAFHMQSGRDPITMPDAPRDTAWRRFRLDSITGLVRELSVAVREREKKISAAVFPTPDMARLMVHQDWDRWPLDAVFPMIYHNFYEREVGWVGEATTEGVAALPEDRPLYSGLYLPNMSPDQLEEGVRGARAAGARGVSLFEMRQLSDELLARLRGL